MTQTQQHCSSSDQLLTFLRGQLNSQEESELQLHLNDCVTCRERLENAAADPNAWYEARQFFRSGAWHASSDDSTSNLAEATQGSQRIRQVLDTLGPTDEPESLGRIGGYEVTGVVGAGGMGVVLKAHDRSLDRIVAIKVMSPHLTSSGSARKRFAREAKAAAAVLHPNVIAIHSVASEEASPFLVMPYVRGASLQKRIDSQGPLPLKDTLRIGAQIAAGLAAAHEQGLVHRDIKPANILLEEGVERVTITDFGLARAVDDASMTCSGVIAGTPQYMSPEQTRGEPIDARSDLFSLGSVLYAMCAGRSPFRAETTYGVLHRIANDSPTPVCEVNSDVPDWLGYVIEQLMAKRPDDRFESATQVAALLEGCLAHVQQPAAIPLPKAVASLSPKKIRRPPIGKYIAAAAFAFSMIFAGVLIVLESNKGTLTIECEADDVSIRIMQGEQTVEKLTVLKSGTTTRLKAGEYMIEIDEPGSELKVANNRISISRGENEIVKVIIASNLSKEKPNVDTETQAQAGIERWLPPDTTAKIIVELYVGKDVLWQMNTNGKNNSGLINLLKDLNAIESVVVNFRESGPGNAIASVIVRDPGGLLNQESLSTGKPSARRNAISKALEKIPSVRWEEGGQLSLPPLGRKSTETASSSVECVFQYLSAVQQNDTETIKSTAKGINNSDDRIRDMSKLLSDQGIPKLYKTWFENQSAIVCLGPISSSDKKADGRFLLFTLSLVDERWYIVDIDLEDKESMLDEFRTLSQKGTVSDATIKSLQGVWDFISVESDGVVRQYKTLTTQPLAAQLTIEGDMWSVKAGPDSGGHRGSHSVKIVGDRLTFYGMTTSMPGTGASIDVTTTGYGLFKLDGDSLVYLMTPAAAGELNGQNESPIKFPETFETKGTQNNVFRLRRAGGRESAASDASSSSKVRKVLNPLEARTLDDVTSVYNEQTRQLRTELFSPPIPDLTTDQMHAAILDAAEQYRRQGRVEIASSLKTSAESHRLAERLTFMGMAGTMSEGFRQITPDFHFEVANNALQMVVLRKAELRYSLKGWSSKAWGDIYPPITGKWDLVSVEESGEALTENAFNAWRQRHANWTQLVIDETSLTMAGEKDITFDFAIDHDSGPLDEFRISQEPNTKFEGVLMGNGFVDDTALVFAVDLEGRSKSRTLHTKDGKTTKLTYRRIGVAGIAVTADEAYQALDKLLRNSP